MSYANRWWITCNGELYNFRDFRRELELSGKRFNAACDNEVLLRMLWCTCHSSDGLSCNRQRSPTS
jgi:asparagine synthetase B (glutamine-hydrolysing)